MVLTVGAAAELRPRGGEQSGLLLTFRLPQAVRGGRRLEGRLVLASFGGRVRAVLLGRPALGRLAFGLVQLGAGGQLAGRGQGAELGQRQRPVQVRRQLLVLAHVAALRLQHLVRGGAGQLSERGNFDSVAL